MGQTFGLGLPISRGLWDEVRPILLEDQGAGHNTSVCVPLWLFHPFFLLFNLSLAPVLVSRFSLMVWIGVVSSLDHVLTLQSRNTGFTKSQGSASASPISPTNKGFSPSIDNNEQTTQSVC